MKRSTKRAQERAKRKSDKSKPTGKSKYAAKRERQLTGTDETEASTSASDKTEV